ncbi:PREDICTED: uncharacterized protein LOC18586174 [Theobroma cacao]|uniref:Uncharacterized protein LOC18586174 n=1 Tax=Theobroma cacao TaxID=3641 RepID=A0AB32X295_THECC|nr:PREDICTED: uncharacterized protein LOC18586174 [Theobroma cacao]
MELQHFSHKHPLLFNEERSHESEKQAYCSGCGELVSGPTFSCAECGFYLDKNCAEAPSEVNHCFHRDHSLQLLVSPPYIGCWGFCDFCGKRCDKFVYHCSCKLDFHIKCALFSKNVAERRFGELEDIGYKDPLISSENGYQELKEAECFACWKPLLDSAYLSLDFGFFIHKKCVDLPIEISHLFHCQHPLILQFNSKRLPCQICQRTQPRGFVYCCSPCQFALHIACAELPIKINHLCHRIHPLILQFNPKSLPCQICQETQGQGFVYCCSICKFALHVKCVSPPPSIKGEIHEHPFTLFWRQVSFICDACGTIGDYVSYICSTCSFIVHKKCISLPHIIKLPRHHHPISHTFILGKLDIETWECKICPGEVNAQHGGYCCFDCNYIVHANCAKEDSSWYQFYEIDGTDEQLNEPSVFSVVKESKVGENVIPTEIKHLSHQHNLILGNADKDDDKFCVGCMLSISSSFYYCSQCDFFLHKSCAESPRKKHLWFHIHQRPCTLLISDLFFYCSTCSYEFNIGFAYECNVCEHYFCLRCALTSDTATCRGHEHLLTFYGTRSPQLKWYAIPRFHWN